MDNLPLPTAVNFGFDPVALLLWGLSVVGFLIPLPLKGAAPSKLPALIGLWLLVTAVWQALMITVAGLPLQIAAGAFALSSGVLARRCFEALRAASRTS